MLASLTESIRSPNSPPRDEWRVAISRGSDGKLKSSRLIFLIVDRGSAHRAKKTKAFVATLGPPYSPDRNPDELVGKHLNADPVGRRAIPGFPDFKAKVKSLPHSLPRNAGKIRSFFHKDTLKYAA